MAAGAGDAEFGSDAGFCRFRDWFGRAAPALVVVLGSGLGEVALRAGARRLPYGDVLPWVTEHGDAVAGHDRCYVALDSPRGAVLYLQGRLHTYEGLDCRAAVQPLAYALQLRPECVLITNAAGCLREDWHPGELMLIRDHINLLGDSPLRGGGDPLGARSSRFVDMTMAYDSALRGLAMEWGGSHPEVAGVLREGVYAAVQGPQYETPSEIRMLRMFGADAVGMSTVPEVILCRAFSRRVMGLSVLTNWAAGVGRAETLDHAAVLGMTHAASTAVADLIEWLLPRLRSEKG